MSHPVRLIGPKVLAASATTEFIAKVKTTVTYIHLCNTDSSTRTVDLSIGANATGTKVFDDLSLATKEVFTLHCKLTLEQGEYIQALASSANVVAITVNGEEAR